MRFHQLVKAIARHSKGWFRKCFAATALASLGAPPLTSRCRGLRVIALCFVAFVVVTVPACGDRFSCQETRRCSDSEDAGGSATDENGGASGATGGGGTSNGGAPGGGAGSGGMLVDGGAGGESSGGEGGEGGTPSPCKETCAAPTPLCNDDTKQCVQCLDAQDCTGKTGRCDTATGSCVECLSTTDCTDAKTPKCNAGACQKCTTNEHCAHIPGKTVCDTAAGACVQCTVATEALCNGKSCNPATKTCTMTPVGEAASCAPCVADSECTGGAQPDPDARCVPMTHAGVPRAGGFCLRRLVKTCRRPYSSVAMKVSLSGAPEEQYCTIIEETTRCEAVIDMLRSRSCPAGMDSQCGCVRDKDGNCTDLGETGLCRTVGAFTNQCTYRCGTDVDCPSGRTCSDDSPSYCE